MEVIIYEILYHVFTSIMLTLKYSSILCFVWTFLDVQSNEIGAVAQWYSQRTTVLEVAGSIPAPVIVELL